jgi:hypothetical protein
MPQRIGIFDIEPLSPGKWQVTNTLTDVSHRTYGSWQEVEEQAREQTKAWKRRVTENGSIASRGNFLQQRSTKKS